MLAHSGPKDDPDRPQPYAEHVLEVVRRAQDNAAVMLQYAPVSTQCVLSSLLVAAEYHDLGKLADDNQAALRRGRGHALPLDHIDAGVAHALSCGDTMAAWLVRAHHRPGLPSQPDEDANHFRTSGRFPAPPPLRGARHREWHDPIQCERHAEVVRETYRDLKKYLEKHRAVLSELSCPQKGSASHGLTMRLALSCLVNADHTDSARHDLGREPQPHPEPRWDERAEALDAHVLTLPQRDPVRHAQRSALYEACRSAEPRAPVVSCQAPVGSGKTFAVVRYLLKVAASEPTKLRHIFVVAPYTTIITQIVQELRKALILQGDDPAAVVAEHHHRVEFGTVEARETATLWRAPIVVTTAVQFFETLASNDPASLRKLHEVPGSAVFIDEAHAAMPVELWPQHLRWLQELAAEWSCHFVLTSGSLVRFWEDKRLLDTVMLPELTPPKLLTESYALEVARLSVESLADHAVTREELVGVSAGLVASAGPVLLILNTVQSAAVIALALARRLRDIEDDEITGELPLPERRVLHLSTALCPRDRDRVLEEIFRRQEEGATEWILVATSCVEAGIELDFLTGLRERCSVTSFIQTGGRINRHSHRDGARLFDFTLAMDDPRLTEHPGFRQSREVFGQMWPRIEARDPTSNLATEALRLELERKGRTKANKTALEEAELAHRYPEVARLGRVIATDTCTVIVDQALVHRLKEGDRPSMLELQRGSVQLWTDKVAKLGVQPVFPPRGHRRMADLYDWPHRYDPDLLGVMAGALELVSVTII